MTDELKSCPFCGSESTSRESYIDRKTYYRCSNLICPSNGWFTFQEWQSRPLEDALQKRIDELTHKNEVLMDSYLESETINDKGELAGSLQYFRQRIADLEAENKALKLIAGSHSMSELRRLQMQTGWFKYPPAPERKEQ